MVLAFEVLCTRRWKGLIRRGAVTLVLLVVANAALIGGILGADLILRSYSPNADKITSVKVLDFEGYESGYGGSEYYTEKTASIKLTDPAIKKMVSTQLHHTLDLLSISENKYYEESNNAASMVVSIQSGGISHVRRIIVYKDDVELLANKLAENQAYRDVYMHIPTNYTHILSNEMRVNNDADVQQFMEVFQNEINEIGFEKWFDLLNNKTLPEDFNEKYGISASPSMLTSMHIFIPNNTDWSEINVPLYPHVMPKTCAAYLEMHAKKQGRRGELLDILTGDLNSCDGVDITMTNATIEGSEDIDKSGNTYYYWEREDLLKNGDSMHVFAESLRAGVHSPIDPTKPLCFISVAVRVGTENDGYRYEGYEGFFALPENFELPTRGQRE